MSSTALDFLLLFLVAIGPVATTVVNRIVDGARIAYDSSGVRVENATTGIGNLLATVGFTGLSVLVAALVIVRGLRQGTGALTWVIPWAVLAALTATVRQSPRDALTAWTAVSIVIAAGFVRADRRALSAFGWAAGVAAAFQLFYSFGLRAPDSLGACRDDKCTVAGALLSGTFWAENTLAIFFAALLPAVALIGSDLWRRLSFVAVAGAIYLSGSRGGYVALAAALAAYAALRVLLSQPASRARRDWFDERTLIGQARPYVRLLCALPIVAAAASVALMLVLTSDDLTNRGSVYEAVRSVMPENPFFGAGLERIRATFFDGQTAFLMSNEHGQIPYVINRTGLIGLFFFVLCVIGLWRRSRTWDGAVIGVMLVGCAVLFMTEVAMMPTYGLSFVGVVLLTLALATASAPRALVEARAARLRRRRVLAMSWRAAGRGALVGAPTVTVVTISLAVVAANLYAVLRPPAYQGSVATMAFAPNVPLWSYEAAPQARAGASAYLGAVSSIVAGGAAQSAGAWGPGRAQSVSTISNGATMVTVTYTASTRSAAAQGVAALTSAAVQRAGGDDASYYVIGDPTVTRIGLSWYRALQIGLGVGAVLTAMVLLIRLIRARYGWPRTESTT